MKLAKALKLKNQLAGEVGQLQELLAKQNVRSARQNFDYNSREVVEQLRSKVTQLVRVKTAIALANVDAYEQIFRLAELKGLISALKALDTRSGVFHEGRRFGDRAHEFEYIAELSKVVVDSLVSDFEKEVQTLQDTLDGYD